MTKTAALVLAILALAGPARAAPPAPPTAPPDPARPWLIPPVDAPVGARFDAPEGPYSGGHRGLDYVVPAGTRVRAAADGRVAFAGYVPGGDAVTIEHAGGMETTYSLLDGAHVSEGDFVAQGRWIGVAGRAHGGMDGGLHFGVKVGGVYADPELYLGPLDVTGAIHLVPLDGPASGRTDAPGCRVAAPVTGRAPAPNDNVAVVLAGIASETDGGAASAAFALPARLGYRVDDVYRFSYRGVDGPRHHERYGRPDTYRPIAESAGKLSSLMLRIAHDHPGVGVDLIAHSQGGLVARAYLERAARAWQRGLPRVEHLVTFATPHEGTDAAALGERMRAGSVPGFVLTEGAKALSGAGAPIPPPDAPVLRDLAPGSALLESLAAQDVLYGTRVLSLAGARDPLVPAGRALYDQDRVAVVEGQSWFRGHSEILGSERALALSHHFLRDGGPACDEGSRDPLGGRLIDALHRLVPAALGRLAPRPDAVATLLRVPGMTEPPPWGDGR